MVLFCTYLPWIWYSRSILGLYYGRHDTKLLHGETSPRPFLGSGRLLNLKRGHRSARAVRAWIHSCVCAVDARDRFDSRSVRAFRIRAFVRARVRFNRAPVLSVRLSCPERRWTRRR